MTNKIEFTRVNNDVYGNPRYVCHFLNFIKGDGGDDNEANILAKSKNITTLAAEYIIAVKRANKIGGRKFHNKQYDGGIVFQSYNIAALENRILNLMNNDSYATRYK